MTFSVRDRERQRDKETEREGEYKQIIRHARKHHDQKLREREESIDQN